MTTAPCPKIGLTFRCLKQAPQEILQTELLKERLEDNQPGDRCEMLILEADLRQGAGFRMYVRSANLHSTAFLFGLFGSGKHKHTNSEAVFLSFLRFLSLLKSHFR
jgi:hypothetical protein